MGATNLDYDLYVTGIGNPSHPANEIQSEELTELERAEEYILSEMSALAKVKAMIAEMQKLEASGACRIVGLSTEDENLYLKLREQSRMLIKKCGHGIE